MLYMSLPWNIVRLSKCVVALATVTDKAVKADFVNIPHDHHLSFGRTFQGQCLRHVNSRDGTKIGLNCIEAYNEYSCMKRYSIWDGVEGLGGVS